MHPRIGRPWPSLTPSDVGADRLDRVAGGWDGPAQRLKDVDREMVASFDQVHEEGRWLALVRRVFY